MLCMFKALLFRQSTISFLTIKTNYLKSLNIFENFKTLNLLRQALYTLLKGTKCGKSLWLDKVLWMDGGWAFPAIYCGNSSR